MYLCKILETVTKHSNAHMLTVLKDLFDQRSRLYFSIPMSNQFHCMFLYLLYFCVLVVPAIIYNGFGLQTISRKAPAEIRHHF